MENTAYTEFLKFWRYHLTMTVAGCTKNLVNQVEPLFARSLVECDEVRIEGNYTGSAYCGDSKKVINEGFRISAFGQSQESLAMMISLAVVALLSDAYGRKPALFGGVFCTALSVVTFIIGAQKRSWGLVLFGVGQGLQGFFPNDFIGGLCSGDISQNPKTDALRFGQVGMMIGQFVGPVMMGLSTAITVMQCENYTAMWMFLLIFNCVGCYLASTAEETKPPLTEDQVLAQKEHGAVKAIFYDYVDFFKKPAVWRIMLSHFIATFETISGSLITLQIMAFHGWTQAEVAKCMMSMVIPAIFVCPHVVNHFSRTRGSTATFLALYGCHYFVGIFERLSVEADPYLWFMIAMFRACFNGKDILAGLSEMQLYETKDGAKINYLKWQVGYFAAFMANPFYYAIFDANAKTYEEKVFPSVCCIGIDTCKAFVMFVVLWSFNNKTEGFGPVMKEYDALLKELMGYTDEIIEHLKCTKYRAKRMRKAGFEEIFAEFIGENRVDDWMLDFRDWATVNHVVRPWFEGKHLRITRGVVESMKKLRDAEAAMPLPEKKKKEKKLKDEGDDDAEGDDAEGADAEAVSEKKVKKVKKVKKDDDDGVSKTGDTVSKMLMSLDPDELIKIFGNVVKAHPEVLEGVSKLADDVEAPVKAKEEKKDD